MSASRDDAYRLSAALEAAGISVDRLSSFQGGWAIVTTNEDSIVSHAFSYGGKSDLWEVYPANADDVTGWLTIDEVVSLLVSLKA